MFEERNCSNCDKSFTPHRKRMSRCLDCKREYDRQYHKNRSDDVKRRKQDLQLDRIRETRQYVYDYLKVNPCVNCGESDPCVLDFDHINPSEKENTVANMVKRSLNKVIEEISKCQVLCANCHRRRTAQQFNWYKDLD